jgi:hypothetical protein
MSPISAKIAASNAMPIPGIVVIGELKSFMIAVISYSSLPRCFQEENAFSLPRRPSLPYVFNGFALTGFTGQVF